MQKIKFLVAGILISMLAVAEADYYSLEPPEVSDLSLRSIPVNAYSWREDVADLHAPGGVTSLPIPQLTKHKVMTLSMKEAILLSLRNNPNIQSKELNRIVEKFALVLAHNGFEPQYTLGGNARLIKGQNPIFSSNAGVSLKTTLGTQINMDYSNTYTGGGGPGQTSLTITQPLLQNFGREFNLIPWKNAIDTENSARLTFKGDIITQVVAVITAYRQLIQDYQSLAIQKRTLANNLEMVKQSELKVKVGRVAENDLLQQQATYETTNLQMLQQQSSFITNYQVFLTTLGLKADATVHIVKKLDYDHLKVPSLKKCIELAIRGNIPYQISLIQIRAVQRAVITAKNANRWSLDLAGSFNIFGAPQPNFQVVNGATVITPPAANFGTPNLTLTLNIPINNVAAEQGIITSEVQLQQAKLALEAARLELVRKITNDWQQIQNQILTVRSAAHQVAYQRRSLEGVQIKYRYGRTTTFEVNQIQDQLLTQETTLVTDQIALLNLITTLNQELGITLNKWGIELRY